MFSCGPLTRTFVQDTFVPDLDDLPADDDIHAECSTPDLTKDGY